MEQSTKINFAILARNWAYEIERQAKNANRDANEEYAAAIDGNRAGTKSEDDAWDACQRTARLCDAADEAVMEVENILFDHGLAQLDRIGASLAEVA